MYPTVDLRPGMNSPEVKKLQEWLIGLGYSIPAGPTTYFGSQTKAAVEQFQRDNNIDTKGNYGFWGPITRGVINTGNYTYPNKQDSVTDQSGSQNQPTDGTNTDSTSSGSSSTTDTTKTPYYGDTKNTNLESAANTILQGMFSAGDQMGIAPSYVDQIRNNKELVAFYIIAMAYGDYTPADIVKDMKRRELASNGDKKYEDITIISGDMDRNQYVGTNEGSLAMNMPVFKDLKPMFGDIDPKLFDLPIFDPGFDQAFKKLVPLLDPESPEFKEEKDKIKAVFYDVIEQQNNAATEQQKAVADYTYGRLVDYLQKTYGVTLSNNAQEAWKQIETIGTNYAAGNIYESGLRNEAVDDALKTRRRGDQVTREKFSSDKEEAQYKYFRENASPAEIKRLIDEDIAKGLTKDQWRATKWGLTPGQDVLNNLSVEAMMQNDPKLTREMAERYRASIIDENGNYRSNLYQTQYSKNYGIDPNSVFNQREVYKANKVWEKSLDDERKAYAPYTSIVSQIAGSNTGGSPGLRPGENESTGAAVVDSQNNPSSIPNVYTGNLRPESYGLVGWAPTLGTESKQWDGSVWVFSNNGWVPKGYTSIAKSGTTAPQQTNPIQPSVLGAAANLSSTPQQPTKTPTYTAPNVNYSQTNPTNTGVQYVTAADYAFKPGESLQDWQKRVANYRIK